MKSNIILIFLFITLYIFLVVMLLYIESQYPLSLKYDLASSSSEEFALKQDKMILDEFEVDDDHIESRYAPYEWNRSHRILKDKLRVRQFQLYFKSNNLPLRASKIRTPQDIDNQVTKQEMEAFESKGWQFSLPTDAALGDSFDYYRCLIVKIGSRHRYHAVFSTYENDKEYDKLYNAISEHIKVGMHERKLLEVAETVCRTSFPGFSVSIALAACRDWLAYKELEFCREERAALNLKLWDEVNNKREFWDVLYEIYMGGLHSYPYHAGAIIDDFSDSDEIPRRYNIEIQFEKFCQFVRDNSGKELKRLALEFAEKECVIRTTYAQYAKEKMRVAKKLGILH